MLLLSVHMLQHILYLKPKFSKIRLVGNGLLNAGLHDVCCRMSGGGSSMIPLIYYFLFNDLAKQSRYDTLFRSSWLFL